MAQGRNAIWRPRFDSARHAETETLRAAPRRLTLYTTLEPCLMGLGAILLYPMSQVGFGSADGNGGARLGGSGAAGGMQPAASMPLEIEAALARCPGPR